MGERAKCPDCGRPQGTLQARPPDGWCWVTGDETCTKARRARLAALERVAEAARAVEQMRAHRWDADYWRRNPDDLFGKLLAALAALDGGGRG